MDSGRYDEWYLAPDVFGVRWGGARFGEMTVEATIARARRLVSEYERGQMSAAAGAVVLLCAVALGLMIVYNRGTGESPLLKT